MAYSEFPFRAPVFIILAQSALCLMKAPSGYSIPPAVTFSSDLTGLWDVLLSVVLSLVPTGRQWRAKSSLKKEGGWGKKERFSLAVSSISL